MPPKRWRIDGNFVASPGEFLLQGNPTVQSAHCAVLVGQLLAAPVLPTIVLLLLLCYDISDMIPMI